ncbi:MAG: hypothetical protein ACREJC_21215 [Tepidisphaeraceae bacterium]
MFLGFENVKDAYEQIHKLTPEQRGAFTTAVVMFYVSAMIYYIVAGLVVFALGKRLIQASFAAFKEARRERT